MRSPTRCIWPPRPDIEDVYADMLWNFAQTRWRNRTTRQRRLHPRPNRLSARRLRRKGLSRTPPCSQKASRQRSRARCCRPCSSSEFSATLRPVGFTASLTARHLACPRYSGLASLQLMPVPVGAPANSATALVHYETLAQATVAKEALDGFLVDRDAPMRVSWAQRA